MNCSPYAVKAVLEALQASFGKIKNPEAPALAMYEQQTLRQIPGDANPIAPKFMFTLFNGGKSIGSKVKFARFYLILQHEMDDLQSGRDALQIYYKVSSAIKKAVQTHKLGENGFKPNASGAYFNAHENHNETFKLVEDAINASGANVSFSTRSFYFSNIKLVFLLESKLIPISFSYLSRASTTLMALRTCTTLRCSAIGTLRSLMITRS